ncbi:MAG: hypothetical protein D6704_04360 [Nitrospirae bacterium]|nr:MAG: hypothetical protein D6704_04360 [Nitrospirota bacterium]
MQKPSLAVGINAVLGSMVIVVGLWFLMGGISLPVTVVLVVVFTVAGIRMCPTVSHIWMWSTLCLGLESLAWPVQTMGALSHAGPEPPLEDMKRVFTAVLFGLFSGVFWLTFAYGLYRRTQHQHAPLTSSRDEAASHPKTTRKKNRR